MLFFSEGFRYLIQELTTDDVTKIWNQFTSSIDVTKTRRKNKGFDKALRNVVCAGLWALHYRNSTEARKFFFCLNNDLYTVNLNVLTSKGWNVATSMKLDLYQFQAPNGAALIAD